MTPRKDLIGGILAGLEQDGAVVLTGPSGVGKSAVLWSVPHAAPGILWFQVHRLVLSDVEAIIRLVRAYRCSDARPIGLLIDSAGRGDRLGWTSLRERAAATPGLLIVATARHEDLVLLGDLNTCTTITVTLDETAASEIYDALKRRGATDLPHWREAFEQSGQLTLEYTYLLTNRRRLSDVVSDQIRRRIDDGRLKEIDVVSLVALADQWGASLSVDALAKACSLNPLELRKQLIRLLDEHLISESDGVVQGLHPVRSIAISNAIHNTPPPARHQTFTRVLSALDNSQISTFVVNALRDQPQLADAVTSAARQALLVELDFERVVAYMRGTRFFDFWTDVTQWMSIADHHGVPHGQRPLLFLFGIGDLTVPEDFPQEIVAARLAMASSQPASVADALVTSVNLASHIGELVESPDLRVVAALMFEAGALEDEDAARFIGLLDGETPLGRVLAAADASELSRVISTVRVVSPDVATKFLDVAGGEARVLELVRALNPWITELQVDNHPEGARIVARLLHVSDDVNGDPHDRVVELARVLLHCIPYADHVDIRVVLPGGHPYRLGEYDHGVTQLQSRYNQADVITSRNRERMKISRLLLGETDTVRLSSALPLLNEASTILEEVARCFVTQDVTGIDADALAHRCNDLGDRVGTLRPALGERKLPRLPATFTIEGDDEGSLLVNDHLAGLVTDITGNVIPRLPRQDQAAALASHINDHVIGKSLHGAKSERWHLLGMEPYPPVLDKIHDTLVALLSAIAEISRGPAARTMITRSARAGRRDSALIRARNTAITIRRRRLQRTRREIVDACRQVNVATQILTQNDASYELVPELAIVIDLDSIADWETSVSAAIEAIENLGLETAKLTFVPMRNRQPVEQFAVTRIIETWPSGQLGIWRKQLAEPWDLALLGAFDTAVQSLQVQSGLLCAGSNRCGTPELTRVAESQNEKYLSAEPALRSDEPDVVVSHLKARLDELVQRLCEEANGQQQPGNLAGELWASALGYGTADIAGQIAVDRLLAVEWSIDRQQALRLASPLQ